jgi:hypothetical protein
MSLTDLITLLQAHNWLGLIALLTLLARKWTSADSKFPVTIPPTWQPTVTAAGGLIYGLVSGWSQGPGSAVLSMLITGFATAIFVSTLIGLGASVYALAGLYSCTPAQQAMFGKIENLVLADIEAGKTRQQIEADVGQLLAGQVGVDIVAAVDAAITLLLASGQIPVGFVPQAKAMLAMHQVCK